MTRMTLTCLQAWSRETYYMGVSGAGNLPGEPGGYNAVTGIPGSAGQAQPGGPLPFELSLIALPHDQSTRLIGFSLELRGSAQPEPDHSDLVVLRPHRRRSVSLCPINRKPPSK